LADDAATEEREAGIAGARLRERDDALRASMGLDEPAHQAAAREMAVAREAAAAGARILKGGRGTPIKTKTTRMKAKKGSGKTKKKKDDECVIM
jgi:hypothetical protein